MCTHKTRGHNCVIGVILLYTKNSSDINFTLHNFHLVSYAFIQSISSSSNSKKSYLTVFVPLYAFILKTLFIYTQT